MEALNNTLSNRRWTFWKSNSGEKNLKEIAKKANDKYIDSVTGRGFWGNLFRSNKDVAEKLKSAGYDEVNDETVKKYFRNLIADAVESGDKEKIKDAYDEAFKIFGDLLKDTEDPELKAILTAAISELQAEHRNIASKLTISSSRGSKSAQESIAKGLSDNYRMITCSKDALGNRTSEDDNLEISQTSFQYMSEEDSIATLDETKTYIKTLEEKIQNGETLSEEEQIFYDSVRYSQYAGAIVGASCNVNYPSPDNVLGKIDTDTAELGIQERVYQTASAYVESHQNSLPITTQEFTQKVDKATNGNYTTVVTNQTSRAEHSTASDRTTNKTPNQGNAQTKDKTNTPTQIHTQETAITQNNSQQTVIQSSDITAINIPAAGGKEGIISNETATPVLKEPDKNTEKKEIEKVSTETDSTKFVSSDNAIKAGVKAVKQYAKDNNLNTLDLAIDSLNSNFASSATRKWALAQFKAASNSEQILSFNKITDSSSAVAAARIMDTETRSQLNTFRSYYIKEAVANINEAEIA